MRLCVLLVTLSVVGAGSGGQEPVLLAPLTLADDSFLGPEEVDSDFVVDRGFDGPTNDRWSVQILGGHYRLVNGDSARTAVMPDGSLGDLLDFDYAIAAVRLGYTPARRWFEGRGLQGSASLLFEYAGAYVTDGFGRYFTGPSILGRYTFQPEGWRLNPYLQGGLGFVFTDAHQDQTQRLIGGDFEFLLQTHVGLQYWLNDRWSFDVEGGLQHISNAGTRSRNWGANTLGGSAGFTYRFGRVCK
jgi:hypothetical protein